MLMRSSNSSLNNLDIWMTPEICNAFLRSKDKYVKVYLSQIHKQCRDKDPEKRPNAGQLLKSYRDVQLKLQLSPSVWNKQQLSILFWLTVAFNENGTFEFHLWFLTANIVYLAVLWIALMYTCHRFLNYNATRKYLLCGYILGVITDTTAWDRHWGCDETMNWVLI